MRLFNCPRPLWLGLFLVWACSSGKDSLSDSFSDSAPSGVPDRLSQAGLYADMATETLALNVNPYTPRFPVWADGAEKRRWAYLPTGTAILTQDMNTWDLPEGARLWKEFTRDGVRIETRMLWKYGPGSADWEALTYLWDESSGEAWLAPEEGVEDALGTPHDVPSRWDCQACHGVEAGLRPLGFSAVQLDHEGEGLTLSDLIAQGALSHPDTVVPQIPGDQATQSALGVLHSNCGACHSDPNPYCTIGVDLRLWLRVEAMASVQDTDTYRSAVGVPAQTGTVAGADTLIVAGDAEASVLFHRMALRDGALQMPPLGTDLADADGLNAVKTWINALEE